MDIETRTHPRIHVNWPTVIETRQGSIAGKTSDISVAGVFILSSAEPEIDQRISILLEPPGERSIRVIGKMVWSDNFDLEADWAFASYSFSDQVQVRIGKIKLPTFLVSDFIEVGYSYPWIRPPQEVYTGNPITSIVGGDLLFTPRWGGVEWLIQP